MTLCALKRYFRVAECALLRALIGTWIALAVLLLGRVVAGSTNEKGRCMTGDLG
jgi:hypothetical protein